MKYILFATFLACSVSLFAQKEGQYKVEASKSEVLLGNAFALTFTLENLQNASFSPPDWSAYGLTLVGGPSQSSNVQIINGDVSSTYTYRYYVRADVEGLLRLPEFSLKTEKKTYKTNALEITVLPNPDGIIEEPIQNNPMDSWGGRQESKTKKKKRETVKL